MKKIKVFYNEKMVVNKIFETPSPRKPKEVVEQWLSKYSEVKVEDFNSLEKDDFYLSHKRDFVDGVLDLSIANGMSLFDLDVNNSLFWTSGSLYAAALEALKHGVAISPTSGFHHSGWDYCWGFCTFNGLMVTAQKLISKNLVKKVGILDFDYHQGDGTESIIENLDLFDSVLNITAKSGYERKSKSFFEKMPKILNQFKNVDVILYQAGANQHVNDPLGGFLTNEEMRLRDKMVFEFTKTNKIPIVWNLAGGYQEDMVMGSRSIQKVLDIHNATLEECIKLYNV